jgi:stress response protein YsnF
LREEYKVGKREVTQNEVVGDSVRRERLLIDDARDRSDD